MRRIATAAGLIILGTYAFAEGPQISGFWELNEQVLVDPGADPVTGRKPSKGSYYDAFSRLRLKLDADVSESVGVTVSGDFRLYGSTGLYEAYLEDPALAYHIDATLWEAYFVFEDMLEGLDLKLGKQRIAWGTADKLNPTDQLNPYDLSDMMNMWEHVPTIAMKLSYTPLDEMGFDLIWEPAPKPMLLPRSRYLQDMFVLALGGGMGEVLGVFQRHGYTLRPRTHLESPEFDIKHSVEGVKVRGTLFSVDYSISYVHGWESIPVPKRFSLSLDPGDSTNKTLDMDSYMGMFEYHMVGADAAWDLWGMGWRLEGAVYFPMEEVVLSPPDPKDPAFQKTMGVLMKDAALAKDLAPYMASLSKAQTMLPKHPYFHLTAGIDYTFEWKMYVNFQYAHGLMFERGYEEDIHDYFMLRIEQNLFYDKLKLSLSGMFGVMDWGNIGDDYSLMVMPEVEWIPYDSLHLSVGGWILDAKGESFFKPLSKLDMVYLKAKVDF